jgi:hypothetical protein
MPRTWGSVATVLARDEYGDIIALNAMIRDCWNRNTLITVDSVAPAPDEVRLFSGPFLGPYIWNMKGKMELLFREPNNYLP